MKNLRSNTTRFFVLLVIAFLAFSMSACKDSNGDPFSNGSGSSGCENGATCAWEILKDAGGAK